MTPAIETSALIKHFGATRAVDGIDLRVERGAVYGLLGPNGAGKTTTIRVLATLLRPDGGSARVLGLDVVREPDKVREKVSLTGQFASVDEDLTGHENLVLVARLFGYGWKPARTRADELLAAFDLAESAAKQVRIYSGGMRRKLDIAASLVVTPELLFLDEPTTGLDPRSRNQVWDIVRSIAAGGTTVLLTTQYLEEADRLADRLAVIDRRAASSRAPSAATPCTCGSRTPRSRATPSGSCARSWAVECTMDRTPIRSPPASTVTARSPRRSRHSHRPGSVSRSSPSASRASTTCFSR